MIIILAVISLHDFLISGVLRLPIALHISSLAYLRSLDRVVSSLEYVVPILFFAVMIVLFSIRQKQLGKACCHRPSGLGHIAIDH